MNITFQLIVSILAPILTFCQLIPQLYKTYKTKRIRDMSIHSILIILLSNVLWFIHGMYIYDTTLIFSGIISSMISFCMVILYLQLTKF